MIVITTPQSRLQKVVHLLKVAEELNILDDKMFDILMDKAEKNPLLFEYFIENINELIINKIPIETTKDNFMKLMFINTYAELIIENVYIPYKEWNIKDK